MEVIEILVEDHRHILELLSLMNKGAERIVSNQPPPAAFFSVGLELAREFADKYHHYKEEYLLFGLLAQKHQGELDGHIERHRNQHEQCRNLIQSMASALPGYATGTEASVKTLHRDATEYVRILRSHIRSENDVFFPLAQAAVAPDEASGLLDEFRLYEAKVDGDAIAKVTSGLDDMRSLLQAH